MQTAIRPVQSTSSFDRAVRFLCAGLLTSVLTLSCDHDSSDGGSSEGGAVMRLVEIDDQVVATGLGPAMTAANGRLYVGYGSMGGTPSTVIQRVAVVTTSLTVEHDMAVYSDLPGGGSDLASADIRMARRDDCVFWYAYEVVQRTSTLDDLETAYALAAEYDVCGNATPTQTVTPAGAIATSLEGAIPSIPPGTELVNDPTPFVLDGVPHVADRVASQKVFQVHELDAGLTSASDWSLDLTGVLSSDMAHQNAVVPHAGGAWLIQQSSTGPLAMGGTSNLVLVELDAGVTAGTAETPLSSCPDYETYSIGALVHDGLLYVGYQLSTDEEVRPGMPKFLPRLKVFDSSRSFALVDGVDLDPSGAAGERVTVEVVEGAVFVAYLATEDDQIHVKKLQWHPDRPVSPVMSASPPTWRLPS